MRDWKFPRRFFHVGKIESRQKARAETSAYYREKGRGFQSKRLRDGVDRLCCPSRCIFESRLIAAYSDVETQSTSVFCAIRGYLRT